MYESASSIRSINWLRSRYKFEYLKFQYFDHKFVLRVGRDYGVTAIRYERNYEHLEYEIEVEYRGLYSPLTAIPVMKAVLFLALQNHHQCIQFCLNTIYFLVTAWFSWPVTMIDDKLFKKWKYLWNLGDAGQLGPFIFLRGSGAESKFISSYSYLALVVSRTGKEANSWSYKPSSWSYSSIHK